MRDTPGIQLPNQEELMIEGHSAADLQAPHTGQTVAACQMERLNRLQPKGSCWYCDQPVDSVRRFCSSTCRNDYLEEEEEFGGSE
jgi:hypothetical protein